VTPFPGAGGRAPVFLAIRFAEDPDEPVPVNLLAEADQRMGGINDAIKLDAEQIALRIERGFSRFHAMIFARFRWGFDLFLANNHPTDPVIRPERLIQYRLFKIFSRKIEIGVFFAPKTNSGSQN
jgi:hypothetical protein